MYEHASESENHGVHVAVLDIKSTSDSRVAVASGKKLSNLSLGQDLVLRQVRPDLNAHARHSQHHTDSATA